MAGEVGGLRKGAAKGRELARRRQPLPFADPCAAALEELRQRPDKQAIELTPQNRGLESDSSTGDVQKVITQVRAVRSPAISLVDLTIRCDGLNRPAISEALE